MAKTEFGELFHCERCGSRLQESRIVWLELSEDTNIYHLPEDFPKGEVSQGGFPFGPGCAKRADDDG